MPNEDDRTISERSSEPADVDAARTALRYARRTLDSSVVTALAVGHENTVIASGTEPSALLMLNVGSAQIVRESFHSRFPRPAELEAAIAVVEDEIKCAASMT